MAKKVNDLAEAPVDTNARLVVSDEDKAKAAKWFLRARELGDKRQFDTAIEYYVSGLEFWPEAVEEACKPLHGCAVARKQLGGKKPGLKDTMKRSTSDKNAKQAYVNSLWLFANDPDNVGYIEAVMRNASRLRAEDAAKWAGGILYKSLENNLKTSGKQFQTIIQLFEELGDRAAGRGDHAFGVAAYQSGVEMLNLWRRRIPKDQQADVALKSLSTKLTILKGKYQDGESFRDSVRDAERQADLHDQQRTVQADERLDALIAKADAEYQQSAGGPALKHLVDLLCRRERADEETRAIGLLINEFKRGGEYRWKQSADDIRMKQLGREVREAEKTGDANAVKEARVAQLRFEITVFKDRVERYPSDNRALFEYGVRKFSAGQFDDAIPLFQRARNDPKNRAACGMYLGRCFFRKGYHSQAVSALTEAISEHEFTDDDLAKTMRYWLARAQEAAGERDAAGKTYGEILTLDYNYKDVRARLDQLTARG
jgi:tetratricopeptide (TPR) repeat protein